MVLRGLTAADTGAWRADQRVAWQWWLGAYFEATDDPAALRELIEVSGNSLIAYVDDSIAGLDDQVRRVREERAGGSHLQRAATVGLLLQGADLAPACAEAQLGYGLASSNVGAVVRVESDDEVPALERSAALLVRAFGADRRLTVVTGTTALWLWIPARGTPPLDVLAKRLKDRPVRVALGRPPTWVAGFRRSTWTTSPPSDSCPAWDRALR